MKLAALFSNCISSDKKIDENIKMRHDKGLGIVNQIISILKEVSFGNFHFEIGLLLRITMLVNGILFNTEAMFNIQQKHIDQLEECDKIFMRKLFDSGHGTPIESFYIESSAWPLRYIIMGRKFMFYWALLRKNEDELVKAVFNAQREFPSRKKDDWVSEVQGDLKSCNISYSDEEIKTMSKNKFKMIVREAIDLKVMSYLIELQGKHSKSKSLVYSSVMQPYLRSNKLSTEIEKFLFKLRTRMFRIKLNFSSLYKNSSLCSLCKDAYTTKNEQHLLVCPILSNNAYLREDIKSV